MIFVNLFTCTTEKEVVARWRVVIRPKMAQGQSYSYLNFLQMQKVIFLLNPSHGFLFHSSSV